MQITRNSLETATGPSDWFTGTVYVDPVATAAAPSRLTASSVHFTPGAMQEVNDEGSPVTWGEHVTDEEYADQPISDDVITNTT